MTTTKTRQVLNPFDGSPIAEVPEGDRADAKAAVRAARAAFDAGPWPRLSWAERGEVVRALGARVREEAEALARLETLDTGKTLEESRWDMADVQSVFEYYADLAGEDPVEVLDSPKPEAASRVIREPAGVCAMILPWNYPLLQASWKMAPALAAGCTMVLKPSELTPMTTLRIAELAAEAGVPDGVITAVLGPGATVGAELAESSDVDLVSFTGGVQTGRAIMRAAASNLKRIALELGGKNPHIIFADADLDAAIDNIISGVFFHAGQICSAGARLMLEAPIHDAVVAELAARLPRIRLGSGLDPATRMGPLISAEHRDKVEAHVRAAIDEGAQLAVGGRRPSAPELQSGYFYEPTLLLGCTDAMRIVREEVFGPVISVERFDTEAEVVARANDTVYGLSAGFWTRDPSRVERVSRALRFGTIWANDFNVYFAQAPWGGFKQSGIGRELGRAGLDEYTELKHVFHNASPAPVGWFDG